MQGSHWQEPDFGSGRSLRAGTGPNAGLAGTGRKGRLGRQRERRSVVSSAGSTVPGPGSSSGSTGSTAVKKTAESGGKVTDTEDGRPCQGSATATTPPRVPQPLPPKTSAPLFTASTRRPEQGTPSL